MTSLSDISSKTDTLLVLDAELPCVSSIHCVHQELLIFNTDKNFASVLYFIQSFFRTLFWHLKLQMCTTFYPKDTHLVVFFPSFLFFFKLFFRFTANLSEKYRVPTYPFPLHMYSFPHYLHQSDTFITIYEPTLIHHYHPKCIIYIRIHSWYYTFLEL